MESIYTCIKSALESTSLPKLECYFNEVTKEETVELGNETMSLSLEAVDHLKVVGCLGGHYLLDLTPLEFEAVEAVLLVTVKKGQVRGIETIKGSTGSD